ncbi:MAG TPA: hypothetical protein PKA63_12545 [Oligoflexia bacterium]|nr:hypothetical protein [Oligoflexia bacterium]HMP49486.1 hypothetical protein [Oligoflexia bacterium]
MKLDFEKELMPSLYFISADGGEEPERARREVARDNKIRKAFLDYIKSSRGTPNPHEAFARAKALVTMTNFVGLLSDKTFLSLIEEETRQWFEEIGLSFLVDNPGKFFSELTQDSCYLLQRAGFARSRDLLVMLLDYIEAGLNNNAWRGPFDGIFKESAEKLLFAINMEASGSPQAEEMFPAIQRFFALVERLKTQDARPTKITTDMAAY